MEPVEDLRRGIEAARSGDRAAFDALAARCSGVIAAAIQGWLGKALRRRVEVDDLVQETFLRAFRSIRQFRGESEAALRAWLLSIAEHAVQDQGRRLKAGKGAEERMVSLDQGLQAASGETRELQEALAAQEVSPGQGLRRTERFERLKSVLRTLSPDHARVIQLARVQGLPIKEVARRMERSPEATSMLLLRALLKLKEAFGQTDSFHLPQRSLEKEDEDHAV